MCKGQIQLLKPGAMEHKKKNGEREKSWTSKWIHTASNTRVFYLRSKSWVPWAKGGYLWVGRRNGFVEKVGRDWGKLKWVRKWEVRKPFSEGWGICASRAQGGRKQLLRQQCPLRRVSQCLWEQNGVHRDKGDWEFLVGSGASWGRLW